MKKADSPIDTNEPAIITGSREQLLYLLAESAEIEHTLMCCYLYAAFSLKRAGDSGLSNEESDAVTRWRKTIMDVAVEEMGHLLIVANLTVALGGRPHFGRPNFPISPGYFPSGVVVRLSGFSKTTLDHFIFLERPQGNDDPDSEEFEHADYRREQTIVGLMPSAQDYATIGHLYESIRANIDALCREIGEKQLFIGTAEQQLVAPAIDIAGVDPILDTAAAHAAIDTIIDQGEGSRSDQERSHYRSFVAIAQEFDALLAKNAGFTPAWPVADNPVMRRPPNPEDRVYIDREETARVLDFACASYGLLLRVLMQCFGRRGDDVQASQERLVDAAFVLMRALGSTGGILARLPASSGGEVTNAGMSFTMLRGVEPLISAPAERRLLNEQFTRLADAAGRGPALGVDPSALQRIAAAFATSA